MLKSRVIRILSAGRKSRPKGQELVCVRNIRSAGTVSRQLKYVMSEASGESALKSMGERLMTVIPADIVPIIADLKKRPRAFPKAALVADETKATQEINKIVAKKKKRGTLTEVEQTQIRVWVGRRIVVRSSPMGRVLLGIWGLNDFAHSWFRQLDNYEDNRNEALARYFIYGKIFFESQ